MGTSSEKPLVKLPKTLGACADLYYNTREERLKLQKQVEAIQEKENFIKDHIINTLPKSDSGAMGKLCRVSVVVKAVPSVTDWDKFYEFVAKNRTKGAFALLNRAVNAKATQEYWDAGKEVPGVSHVNVAKLSVNKL